MLVSRFTILLSHWPSVVDPKILQILNMLYNQKMFDFNSQQCRVEVHCFFFLVSVIVAISCSILNSTVYWNFLEKSVVFFTFWLKLIPYRSAFASGSTTLHLPSDRFSSTGRRSSADPGAFYPGCVSGLFGKSGSWSGPKPRFSLSDQN